MQNVQTRQAPLEMLVVAQLAAIKRQERVLKTRLSTSLGHSEKVAAVRSEISALQITTDRLNRMIDAMSI
jgi:hypothetical protein